MLMGTHYKWLVLAAVFGLLWAIILWPIVSKGKHPLQDIGEVKVEALRK